MSVPEVRQEQEKLQSGILKCASMSQKREKTRDFVKC